MARPRKNGPPAGSSSLCCNKCSEELPPENFYWKADGSLLAAICRTCWKAYHAKRGGYQNQRSITCEWCGATKQTDIAKTKFCSRVCKNRAHHKATQAAINAAKPDRTCPTCGAVLTPLHRSDAVFCSEACSSKAHGITRKIRKRIGESGPRPRKVQLVSLAYIAKRDKYRCGICGGKVNMAKRHPDPLAASLDHILPLSAGGMNDLANLQLSHFRCNWSKRDQGSQQLRLLG